MLDEAGTTQKALKADLAFAEGALRVCEGRLRSLEGGNSEELGALKEEVAAITRDRDALISVIDQQEVALQLQNRQSDAGTLIQLIRYEGFVILHHVMKYAMKVRFDFLFFVFTYFHRSDESSRAAADSLRTLGA
jgi:hypothetical protein